MNRRAFIMLLGSAAAGWPTVVHAQQSAQMRRIGVLMNRAADNPQGQIHLAAFQKSLQELGLSDGGNVRIDLRWGANIVDLERRYAAEFGRWRRALAAKHRLSDSIFCVMQFRISFSRQRAALSQALQGG